jgi:hypothetical protein
MSLATPLASDTLALPAQQGVDPRASVGAGAFLEVRLDAPRKR